jgi:hypothetical protein
MGKTSFIIIISLIYLYLITFFGCPILLKLSFTLNFLVLLVFTYYNIFLEKKFSPFLSIFIVFNFLFFIVAPLVQIDHIIEMGFNGSGSFMQSFPFSEGICIRANFYILIFNLIFGFSYLVFKKHVNFNDKLKYNYNQTPFFLLILFIFTLGILVFNFKSILFQFQHEFYEEAEQGTTSQYLITQKFLYFVPFAGLVISYFYIKSKGILKNNYKYVLFFLVFFLVTILVLKNPLTEKRNALGPLYITIIFLFFRRFLFDNYKVLRLMFLSMILLFPALSILTHSRYSLSQMINKPILLYKNIEYLDVTNAFNSLHYDAYANFLATIDYFDKKSVIFGEQLMCSLFFFVPRSIWGSKPETTGFLIGNYLIDKYNFDWDNLSNPYISESYINFGFLGIIIFAIILSFVFVVMIKWLQSEDYLKSIFAFYFSIYLMYFLRGDLTSAFAYIIAFLFALVFVPKIILAFINFYVKK